MRAPGAPVRHHSLQQVKQKLSEKQLAARSACSCESRSAQALPHSDTYLCTSLRACQSGLRKGSSLSPLRPCWLLGHKPGQVRLQWPACTECGRFPQEQRGIYPIFMRRCSLPNCSLGLVRSNYQQMHAQTQNFSPDGRQRYVLLAPRSLQTRPCLLMFTKAAKH